MADVVSVFVSLRPSSAIFRNDNIVEEGSDKVKLDATKRHYNNNVLSWKVCRVLAIVACSEPRGPVNAVNASSHGTLIR